MKYKIGVFGSAEGNFDTILEKAKELGQELGKNDVIVITGATAGLPYKVSLEAFRHGAKVWGFSAAVDLKHQQDIIQELDKINYEKLIFIPKDYKFASNNNVTRKYRNVTSTATCDAGIIISGRFGTMNEFTNLYDMEKVIGILTRTGGVADEIEGLIKKIHKKSTAKVIFSDSPKNLVKLVIDSLNIRHSGE